MACNSSTGIKFLLYRCAIAVVGFFLISSAALAQSSHITGYNLGLGGGGAAYVEGYHANFINPANIAATGEDRPSFSIGLMSLGTTVGGPLANIGLYNKYMTNGQMLNNVADKMLDSWFGPQTATMRGIGHDVNVVPVGFALQTDKWSFSLAYRARTLTNFSMSRGSFEFFAFLLDEQFFAEPQPVNFDFSVMTLSEISLGSSRKVWEGSIGDVTSEVQLPVSIYAGVAPKLLMGHNTLDFDFNSRLQVQDETTTHNFNYSIRSAGRITDQLRSFYRDRHVNNQDVKFGDYIDPGAFSPAQTRSFGLGLDLGVTARVGLDEVEQLDWGSMFKGEKFARVSLSLTDVGSVNFNKGAGKFTSDEEFVWRGFENLMNEKRLNSEFDSSRSKYMDHIADSIVNSIYLDYQPANTKSVSRTLPTILHFGTHVQIGRAGLMVDVAQGLADQGITSKATMASFGLEYEWFGVWPIRVGVRTGGRGATSYSIGTGIDLKNFEFSVSGMTVRNSTNGGYYLAGAFGGLIFHF